MRFPFLVATALFLEILLSSFSYAGINRLQRAISLCDVGDAAELLQKGADPNAKDSLGRPIVFWLASSRRCDDATALATAKLLEEHGAKFESLSGYSKPSLLVNLALRRMPHTLAFLSQQPGTGDPTEALREIAGRSDIASLHVLLLAGADPLAGEALRSALFDAAAAGQAASVREMLKSVRDKQSPKVRAAYEFAKKRGNPNVVQAFFDAGIKPPEINPSSAKSLCQPRDLTSEEAHLLAMLGLPNANRLSGLAGAMTCKFIQKCGELIFVDCNSAADGPAYYIDQKAAKLVATCGGACMHGCKDCPPKEWTCTCRGN